MEFDTVDIANKDQDRLIPTKRKMKKRKKYQWGGVTPGGGPMSGLGGLGGPAGLQQAVTAPTIKMPGPAKLKSSLSPKAARFLHSQPRPQFKKGGIAGEEHFKASGCGR